MGEHLTPVSALGKMTFSIQPTHGSVTQQALSAWVQHLSEHVLLNVIGSQTKKKKPHTHTTKIVEKQLYPAQLLRIFKIARGGVSSAM